MKFKELNIINPILKAIEHEGYETPSPIQAKTIPVLLEGKDLLGCAQTGTGKTAAFAMPILQTLYIQRQNNEDRRKLQALILTPTRELAVQICESFKAYGRYTGLRTAVVFGGVSQKPQVAELVKGIDILVATPGRLNDLINQKLCSLNDISILVLDEADRMLDMGFAKDVKKIMAFAPDKRQTLLFSATMPEAISELAMSVLNNPVTVAVTPPSSTVQTIEQSVYFVNKVNKGRLLVELLEDQQIISALIFARTKHGADKVDKILNAAGIKAKTIHGNKSQTARQNALSDFKSGRIRALVATDIASRGIDIEQLSHVINYDLPESPEVYVHRIGRTGRAGLSGTAISFCDSNEKLYLKDIQKLIKKDIEVVKKHSYPLQTLESAEIETNKKIPARRNTEEKHTANKTNNNQRNKGAKSGGYIREVKRRNPPN